MLRLLALVMCLLLCKLCGLYHVSILYKYCISTAEDVFEEYAVH